MTFEYAQEIVASNANLLDFAKCLLVGSAPNPLNARASSVVVSFSFVIRSFRFVRNKKERPLCQFTV